ncbi:MAG TPA: FAD:protein FMN transferase [Propionibacteriaceae bacterium]|nr:FAD:protein FMN transferase [Propionibacteriaceae bacterium]
MLALELDHPPYVFESMGTVVSLRTNDPLSVAATTAVVSAFEALDDRFSLYRPGSEGDLVARRLLRVRHASSSYRVAYDLALGWRDRTEGAFTPHRPDGAIDLSGVVKALAIQAAADALHRHGVRGWCLNAGGDVLVDGEQPDGQPWVVGVVDPDDRTALWTQYLALTKPAVATSGTAERGEHVWRLAADDTFSQVTVAADDIITADVWATAILAGGVSTLELAQRTDEVDVLACTADGRVWASPVFLRPSPPSPSDQ